MKLRSAQDSISSGVFTSHMQVWICKVPILMKSLVFCFREERGLGRRILQSLQGQSVKFSLAKGEYKSWTQQGVKIGMKKGRAVHEGYFSTLAWISTLRSKDLKMFCELAFPFNVNILEQYQMHVFGRQQALVLSVLGSILPVSFSCPCVPVRRNQSTIVSFEVFGICLLQHFRLDQEQTLEINLLVIPMWGFGFQGGLECQSTQMGLPPE